MRVAVVFIALWLFVATTFLYLALAERIAKGRWPHWLPSRMARVGATRTRSRRGGPRRLITYRKHGSWTW